MSNQNLNSFGEAIIQKFVNEEIMTKSELDQKLDNVMNKYVAHIDRKFDLIDSKFANIDNKFDLVDKQIKSLKDDMDNRFAQIDIRYNWIIGLVVTATIGIIGTVIKFH